MFLRCFYQAGEDTAGSGPATEYAAEEGKNFALFLLLFKSERNTISLSQTHRKTSLLVKIERPCLEIDKGRLYSSLSQDHFHMKTSCKGSYD